MSNPRLFLDYANLTGPELPVQYDSSINLPTFTANASGTATMNLSVSSDIYAAVTNVTTSTYAAPADNILVGKGVAGQPVLGQVVTAEYDGFGTIQTRGIMKFKVNGSNPPAINQFCAVDGTGKLQAGGITDPRLANAVCLGYVYDSNDQQFTHLQGNLTAPTTVANGPTVAIVQLRA